MSHVLVSSYTFGKPPQPSDEFHKLLHLMAVNVEQQRRKSTIDVDWGVMPMGFDTMCTSVGSCVEVCVRQSIS